MTVLFVDNIWRKHSHSADFFKAILRDAGCEVVEFWFERAYHYQIPGDLLDTADVVVLWEFLFGRFHLGIPNKRCVYVPMYDNESGSSWQWRRIAMSGMPVISFCERISRQARKYGVKELISVKFAVDPRKFIGYEGNPRIVVLWDRGQVDFQALKQLFAPEDVDKVIVIRKQEESLGSVKISAVDRRTYHIEVREGKYLPSDEYVESLREPGVFVAPRYKEGIGLPFLEQMAMGKCVIAHNEPTMNEYVRDGENGILVDMRRPRRIAKGEVDVVRSKVVDSMRSFYSQWQLDRNRLVTFFQGSMRIPKCKSMTQVMSVVAFVMSVFEYMIWLRFRKGSA